MNKEEKLLITLCDSFINGKKAMLPGDIDWERLYRLAVQHNLAGVCHCALNDAQNAEAVPKDFTDRLRETFYELVFTFEAQERTYGELESLLGGAGLPFVAFKGIELRKLYPVPEARTMSDIDIVIKPEDRDAVKRTLTGAGFDCIRQNGPVYNYMLGRVMTEVHTKLISDYDEGAFKTPFEHADGAHFTSEYHLAYLIAHTAHHFKFYGAGIKLVCDLAVLQKSCEPNMDKAFEYLKCAGLETFAEVILTICYRWFGTGKDYGADTAKAEEYLCRCGAFGNMRKNKAAAVTARRGLEKGGKDSPAFIRLKLLFPPYSELKNIDYIRFIEGRPYLTPYAWCYRLAYNLKNRRQFMKNAVKNIGDEKTLAQAEQELELFKEIGLV